MLQEARCRGDGVKWHIIASSQLWQNFRAVNIRRIDFWGYNGNVYENSSVLKSVTTSA